MDHSTSFLRSSLSWVFLVLFALLSPRVCDPVLAAEFGRERLSVTPVLVDRLSGEFRGFRTRNRGDRRETVATVSGVYPPERVLRVVVVYQLDCADCGESRVGRETDDGIRPVRDECPECGSSEYEVSAYGPED